MKLKEIKLLENAQFDHAEVDAWLKEMTRGATSRIPTFDIVDGVVNVHDHFIARGFGIEELPYKFGRINGCFRLHQLYKLNSTKNFPFEVTGDVSLAPMIDTLENIPQKIGQGLTIAGTRISDLSNASHILEKMHVPEIIAEWSKIKRGGLGLLLINGLTKINTVWLGQTVIYDGDPFSIIKKYLGRPDDIFECQAELIDSGFEEYAKL